jgi:hypothetical protein
VEEAVRKKCYCDVRTISTNNATWVEELNGVSRPFCTTHCHERYLERCALKADLARRERAAREIPPGSSWAFSEHRNMAQVMRQEPTRIVARADGGFDVVG